METLRQLIMPEGVPEADWRKATIYRHTNGIGVNVPRDENSLNRKLRGLQAIVRLHERLKARSEPVENVRGWYADSQVPPIEVEDIPVEDDDNLYSLYANWTRRQIAAIEGMLLFMFRQSIEEADQSEEWPSLDAIKDGEQIAVGDYLLTRISLEQFQVEESYAVVTRGRDQDVWELWENGDLIHSAPWSKLLDHIAKGEWSDPNLYTE